MQFKDYYKILGVNPGSDSRRIRNAYRRLVNLYHPDKHPENNPDKESFLDIREAYDVLADPVKRKEYDKKYENNNDPDPLSPSGYYREFNGHYGDDTDAFLNDIFSRFFDSAPGGKIERSRFDGGSGHIHYDDLLDNK